MEGNVDDSKKFLIKYIDLKEMGENEKKTFPQKKEKKNASQGSPCGMCIMATVHPLIISPTKSFLILYCDSQVKMGKILRQTLIGFILYNHCEQLDFRPSSGLQ